MVYSQSFENRANKCAAVIGLPIFHKACSGVGKRNSYPNPDPKILKNRSQPQLKKFGIGSGIPLDWDPSADPWACPLILTEFFGLISSICEENI